MALTTNSQDRVLGKRYRLLHALGTGASAHVFLAEDLMLQRRVAVKVLLPALSQDQAFLRRFRAEARAAGSLNHPNVMRVFDWGEDAQGKDAPYLVLEYLRGGTLRQLLDHGLLLTPAQAVRVGSEAAQGLAYAHARGIVHRDIKPANLLFDEEGRVRVGDFGVARALAESSWTEPAGAVVGTARYASPEQAQGHPIDGRSDVYALALVLYEAVTGSVPFVGDTPVGTLMARIGQPLPPRATLGQLSDLLMSAAHPHIDARPSAGELAQSLTGLAGQLPSPAPLPLEMSRDGTGGPPADRPGDLTLAPVGHPTSDGDLTATALHGPSGSDTQIGAPSNTAVLHPTVAAPSGAAPGGTQVGPATNAMPATETGAGTPRSDAGTAVAARRRRRALPWVLTAIGLAMLLAAGAVYAFKSKLFTPSHRVPDVVGMTSAQAQRALHTDQFTVTVSARRHSTTVPNGHVISQQPGSTSSLKEGSDVKVVVSRGLPVEKVPSLLGFDCAGAQRILRVVNLYGSCPPAAAQYSSSVPSGQVITWTYLATNRPTSAPWHSTITVIVSNGPPLVAVPQVTGMTYANAAAAISRQNLKATESRQSDPRVPAGEVIGSNPTSGQQVQQGSTVTVEVSSGPPQVQVPNGLLGLSLNEAEAILRAVGLRVGTVSGPRSGVVSGSEPTTGGSATQGSAVNLTLNSTGGGGQANTSSGNNASSGNGSSTKSGASGSGSGTSPTTTAPKGNHDNGQ